MSHWVRLNLKMFFKKMHFSQLLTAFFMKSSSLLLLIFMILILFVSTIKQRLLIIISKSLFLVLILSLSIWARSGPDHPHPSHLPYFYFSLSSCMRNNKTPNDPQTLLRYKNLTLKTKIFQKLRISHFPPQPLQHNFPSLSSVFSTTRNDSARLLFLVCEWVAAAARRCFQLLLLLLILRNGTGLCCESERERASDRPTHMVAMTTVRSLILLTIDRGRAARNWHEASGKFESKCVGVGGTVVGFLAGCLFCNINVECTKKQNVVLAPFVLIYWRVVCFVVG